MNRRSFFKKTLGIIGGVTACFVKKDKIKKKLSGTKFIREALCSCGKQHIKAVGEKFVVSCPHLPPYWVYPDGKTEFIYCYNCTESKNTCPWSVESNVTYITSANIRTIKNNYCHLIYYDEEPSIYTFKEWRRSLIK